MHMRDIKEGELYRLKKETPHTPAGSIVCVSAKIIYHGFVMGRVVFSCIDTDGGIHGYHAFNPDILEELE